ncbi:type II toxin-antitoxin system PemK/MazF family toxin [Polymorphobacter fuscus]|uniref:Type II toxin-antitoxin system PemK/MazF family toxin n=1 Tax=Sandarakinorhabdus fusca TaxID=1439888 RepID=A0A7C9GTF8_9SPHN|nr:type II toxin-antitoxin system PemK/MazF family toxin [Polymorphobacter fuscus]KAB7648855.1 type II toxin-antitoxin system PemK/MazF family toxin [Polymorphobacter fuscus]MQT16438.1 type II toxin-antitoxin system PemK/MazF family toxin [Polymorphobacter fuscus]NJC07272.1 mRNA interferase MazF [Polymorphobacter fuscus]
MTFETFDVVIVPFPFTDKATAKRRPAVVISTAGFAAKTGHVIAVMVTSARQSAWPDDVPLTDLAAAGLPTACVARLKLFTLDAALVIRASGRLAAIDAANLAAALKSAIAPL